MLAVFSPIFVADIEIIVQYDYVAALKRHTFFDYNDVNFDARLSLLKK